jgi:hypothetical protein
MAWVDVVEPPFDILYLLCFEQTAKFAF